MDDAEEVTDQQPSSPVSVYVSPPVLRSDNMLRDVFLWRRRDLSLMVVLFATVTWVLLDVYQFNFVTVVSWVAISIVVLLFLLGNILRLLGKEPPNLSGLEIPEKSALAIANSCRGIGEEVVRWMFNVSVEREWFVFVQVVAVLLLLSYVGIFTDLLTLLYIGIVMGMTVPVIYVKYEDKIKRAGNQVKEKSKRLYDQVDEEMKSKLVITKNEKKME